MADLFNDADAAEIASQMADEVCERGFAIRAGAIPAALVSALRAEIQELWSEDAFRSARIGSGGEKKLVTEIRSDRVRWWEDDEHTPPRDAYRAFLEALRVEINRRTFMGLFGWEGHYAVYLPGTFYRRHLDVFAKAPSRKISVITYLNEGWVTGDGGELRIYLNGASLEEFLDVEPQAGTVVVFESERFYHEVLDSETSRNSITGWFRIRES